MEAGEVLRQGGFAFAALLMGSLLVWSLRLFREFMTTREGFITRLLDRLDKTEQEHGEMLAGLRAHTETARDVSRSLREVETALVRLNGRGK